MDLLFKRYASPFLILDGFIESGQFCRYIQHMLDRHNEEMIYDIWIHKVYDKAFPDFKNEIMNATRQQKPVNLETTVRESENILKNFIPEG